MKKRIGDLERCPATDKAAHTKVVKEMPVTSPSGPSTRSSSQRRRFRSASCAAKGSRGLAFFGFGSKSDELAASIFRPFFPRQQTFGGHVCGNPDRAPRDGAAGLVGCAVRAHLQPMPGTTIQTLGDLVVNHHRVSAWCHGGHGFRPLDMGVLISRLGRDWRYVGRALARVLCGVRQPLEHHNCR